MQGLFAAPSPAPIKTALQVKGLDVGSVRLPLVPLNEQERSNSNKIIIIVKNANRLPLIGIFLFKSTVYYLHPTILSLC